MRDQFSLIYIFLIMALVACSVAAMRSKRTIGPSVALLTAALAPPVIGNLIIIRSVDAAPANIGYYIYFLGMDLVMWALMRFTAEYCNISWKKGWFRVLIEVLLAADMLQYVVDLFTGHAFSIEAITVDGFRYYRLVPYLGQSLHRLLDYGIILVVMMIFFVKMIRSTRVNSERYSVILATMVIASLWQTFYIFSRTPVDRSMIAFGVFGLLIFYFSLYYRPMRLLDRMLAKIASEMTEALFFFDINGKCIWANDPAIELTDISEETFDKADEKLTELFGDCTDKPDNWFTAIVTGSGEDTRHYVLVNHHIKDDKERFAGSFLSIRDNTDEQRKLKREMYNAIHDRLTGIYTREYLYQRISEVIHSSPDVKRYIISLNVRNFKVVNDIFSNSFGDHVLKRIAARIRKELSDNCIYGRLGGDVFGACVPVDEFDIAYFEKILSEFRVVEKGIDYHILIHLGLYEVTDMDTDVAVMFDRAHLAISTIKEEYHKHIAVYDEEMRRKVLWDQHISTQLSGALASGQICPYLQAIVDRTGKIVGAEALARWIHPTEGFLPPGKFIPVFEKNGMIAEVDKFMWKSSCEILSRWIKNGIDLFISVNISPKDFYFMDVSAEIKQLVSEYGIPPTRLRVEITETVMMTDVENKMKVLDDLRRYGFIVEMDDFGSGYSSLNMLKDMPVDVLKIDMKFLSRTEDAVKAHTIVRNIINLSDDLGISALTEGVETENQYKVLSDMGCRMFQGYYFSKPMPVDKFEELCESHNSESLP